MKNSTPVMSRSESAGSDTHSNQTVHHLQNRPRERNSSAEVPIGSFEDLLTNAAAFICASIDHRPDSGEVDLYSL